MRLVLLRSASGLCCCCCTRVCEMKKIQQYQTELLLCNHNHENMPTCPCVVRINSQPWFKRRTHSYLCRIKITFLTQKSHHFLCICCCFFCNPLTSPCLLPREHSIKRVTVLFRGSVSAPVVEYESYLGSGCLISIFHHVKQIEDNEGLRDEGQTCVQHTKRSICFQWDTKACCLRAPHWLCIRDWWSSTVVRLTLTPTLHSLILHKHWCVGRGLWRAPSPYWKKLFCCLWCRIKRKLPKEIEDWKLILNAPRVAPKRILECALDGYFCWDALSQLLHVPHHHEYCFFSGPLYLHAWACYNWLIAIPADAAGSYYPPRSRAELQILMLILEFIPSVLIKTQALNK